MFSPLLIMHKKLMLLNLLRKILVILLPLVSIINTLKISRTSVVILFTFSLLSFNELSIYKMISSYSRTNSIPILLNKNWYKQYKYCTKNSSSSAFSRYNCEMVCRIRLSMINEHHTCKYTCWTFC